LGVWIHRNYRLFFGGQSFSLVGTWITRVATSCGMLLRPKLARHVRPIYLGRGIMTWDNNTVEPVDGGPIR
jgi:hypothetical protein